MAEIFYLPAGFEFIHSLSIEIVRISVFELPPGQHLGEAEEDEGGEVVGSAAAVEADDETATPSVEAEGGHVIVTSAGIHCGIILIW